MLPVHSSAPTPLAAQRLAWFRDARLGLFIHWGVYSVPAGYWQGRPIGWLGEWIMREARIPVPAYRDFANHFTAAAYDPEAWADLAVAAGVRYVVITAKHHEGFALYDSAVSTWNAAHASAAGRDLLTPLARALRARCLKFGLYYSQAQDWIHRGGTIMDLPVNSPGWDPDNQQGDFDAYLRDIALPQVEELITRFDPDILWWDTPFGMTPERAEPFRQLLIRNPHIITNDRLGGGVPGDTRSPEQHIPPHGYPGEMFEVCMTMNDTWGFKKDDANWKSRRTVVRSFSDIATKGGNFLLNIGPDATGLIPAPSITLLRQLGLWMQVNRNAIYGTEASPFPRRLPWGGVTRRTTPSSSTFFLHVWLWNDDAPLLLPTISAFPHHAAVLADGRPVICAPSPDGLLVHLPAGGAPDGDVSILALTFTREPVVSQSAYPSPDGSGAYDLRGLDADTHGSLSGNIPVEGVGDAAYLARWSDHEWRVEYRLHLDAARVWKLSVELAAAAPASLVIEQGESLLPVTFPSTGGTASWQTIPLGELALPAGECVLTLRPVRESWSSIDLRRFILTPSV
jgi:alpha-L-fucosidase